MSRSRIEVNKYQFIENIFRSKAAKRGDPVRRKVASVLKYASVEALKEAITKRGFGLILNGDHFIIICNNNHISLLR